MQIPIKYFKNTNSYKAQLVRGGLGSAFIQIVNRLLTLAMGIVLARGLGAEGYGVYTYAFALMGLLMVVAVLGMPMLLIREVAANEARHDWPHLRGILVRAVQTVSIATTSVSVIGALLLWQLGVGVSANQKQTLAFMLLLLPFAALTKTVASALHGLRKVVTSQAVETLFLPSLVLVTVAVLFVWKPQLRLPQHVMAVQAGGAVFVLCAATVLLFRHLPQPVRSSHSAYQTRHWLGSALPFMLMGGAGIINNQADILLLGVFTSSEEVGVYRVAMQGAVLVAFGLQVVNAVIIPQIARLYAQGEMARLQRLITASARVILLAALPVALVFIVAGGPIAGWVFGPEFVQSHTPLAILAAGQLISAAMGSVGALLIMTGHERAIARIIFVTALMNLGLNFVMVPLFGAKGAALATTISLATWNLWLYCLVKLRLGIESTAILVGKRGSV